jgi:hypothetical protein
MCSTCWEAAYGGEPPKATKPAYSDADEARDEWAERDWSNE